MAKRSTRQPKKNPKAKPKTSANADLQYEVLRELSHRIPQKLIREFTATPNRPNGIQPKQINEQAERYGLAFGGATWDLEAHLQALFPFLSRISLQYKRWMEGGGDQPISRETPSLERKRLAQARLAELQVAREEGRVIPRQDIHDGLIEFAKILRGAGDRLQRQHGQAAYDILDEALTSAVDAVERALAENNEQIEKTE